jgi:hypothetical protein
MFKNICSQKGFDLYSENIQFNSFDYEVSILPQKIPSYSLDQNELEKIFESINKNFVYPITVIPNDNVFNLKTIPKFLKVNFDLFFLDDDLNTSFLNLSLSNISINTNTNNIKKKLSSNTKYYILIHIENKSAISNNNHHQTIFYFHGNQCDLGSIFNTLIDISIQFKSDVISYDYSGFGQSAGKSCLSSLIKIEKISQYLEEKTISAKNLIIFGEDVGAIPAIYLITAEDKKYLFSKSLILLNPYFGNSIEEEKLKEIECNTFVIHYKNIKNIPYEIVKKICSDNIKNLQEWYPKNLKQNEYILASNKREKFIQKIKMFCGENDKSFIKYLQNFSNNTVNLGSSSKIFYKLSEGSTQNNSNILKDNKNKINTTFNYYNNIVEDYQDDI